MAEVRDQDHREWIDAYEGKPITKAVPIKPQAKPKGDLRVIKKDLTQQKMRSPKIVAPDEMTVLIPEGGYAAKCKNYRLTDFWSSSKLVLDFEISEGRFSGTKLECYYNLSRKKNEAGEFDFVPSKRGAYLRMMRQAFSDDHQPDGDRLSPENLLGKTFRVEVATVNKNHAREALNSNQYSKIKTNIELIHE